VIYREKSLAPLQVVGYRDWWPYLQRNISLHLFYVSWP